MELSFQERYDILSSKEKFVELPVSFIHPVNSAPGEPEYEESVRAYWKACDLSRSFKVNLLEYLHSFPLSGLKYKDLDGTHKWRSIRGGVELISYSIEPAQWSGWVLRTGWEDWNRNWEAPDSYRDDRICIETYVLVDGITDEQYQAWENFRRSEIAKRDARLKNKQEVQISMF
jgi:hypothetical protein